MTIDIRALGIAAIAWLASLALTLAAPPDLTYLAHAPVTAAAHPPLIVLLHGVGADERDMIGLWQQLPPAFVVVSPRAPFAEAGGGYRWYGKATRERDIAVSAKIIDLVIDNALERFGADPKRVFVAGFSQGAVMTYEVGLREPTHFRGAAVLSGSLFPSEIATLPAHGVFEPFFIGHGTADNRISFASATAARATLARLGVPTAFHAYPGMAHTISDEETRDLSAWLKAQAGAD